MENVTFIFFVSLVDMYDLVTAKSLLLAHFIDNWGYSNEDSSDLVSDFANQFDIFRAGSK